MNINWKRNDLLNTLRKLPKRNNIYVWGHSQNDFGFPFYNCQILHKRSNLTKDVVKSQPCWIEDHDEDNKKNQNNDYFCNSKKKQKTKTQNNEH